MDNDVKIKAAYALNLCTVSVSQIIDYDDINILEQEYEAILNNLNLEQMPKDEALLNILKQLLETITFFRIEEGDKAMIDKEYQLKMKNAIWNAVPNFGLIVAGGSPLTMAVSIASQVGIGYMNYRKQKAQNQLDYEKEMWQLQRSAIEQFNALRRELFDTAWRLSATYEFEDKLRLTERQINQYNQILMDSNPVRKYERLEAIQNNFGAYPPFWYYFGSAANEIVNLADEQFDASFKNQFKSKAIHCFEKFEEINKYDILREDQLASSCALEHIDLLDPAKDQEKIAKLIEMAIAKSGNACDILQMCAIDYLKINMPEKAAPIFKYLTNENYNAVTNAQFLSSFYVFEYLSKGSVEAKNDYQLLRTRVNPQYLYPMPTDENTDNNLLNEKYVVAQRDIVKKQFEQFIALFHKKYEIEFNKVLPIIKKKHVDNNNYFVGDMSKRITDAEDIYEKRSKWSEYVYKLSQVDLIDEYLNVFNKLYKSICKVGIFDEDQKIQLRIDLEIGIRTAVSVWIYTQKNLTDENYDYTLSDFESLLGITFDNLTREFFRKLNALVIEEIYKKTSINEFVNMQNALAQLCDDEGFPSPENLIDLSNNTQELTNNTYLFELNTLIDDKLKEELDYIEKSRTAKRCIEEYAESIVIDESQFELFVCNTVSGQKSYDKYFSKKIFTTYHKEANDDSQNKMVKKIIAGAANAGLAVASPVGYAVFKTGQHLRDKKISNDNLGIQVKFNAIAVLNDKTKSDFDIVFTMDGVYPIISGKIKDFIYYSDISWTDSDDDSIKLGSHTRSDSNGFDASALMGLFEKLKEI